MMGDINGVTAAQLAHVGGLVGAGLLPEDLRLRRETGVWGRRDLADVYIDDVATLAGVRRDQVEKEGWDDRFMEGIDAFYAEERSQQSVHKAVNGVVRGGRLWGAEVDGLRGEVSAPALRRAGVLCLCLLWLGLGCGGLREALS